MSDSSPLPVDGWLVQVLDLAMFWLPILLLVLIVSQLQAIRKDIQSLRKKLEEPNPPNPHRDKL